MVNYHRAKERLRDQVQAQLLRNSAAKNEPDTPRLRQSLRDEAAGLVDEFERLAESRSYWRGIWQSFLGSVLFAFAVGLVYVVILGTRHSLLEIAAGRMPEQPQPHQAPTASPSPTATP